MITCKVCGAEVQPCPANEVGGMAAHYFDWQFGRYYATEEEAAGRVTCERCFRSQVDALCDRIHEAGRRGPAELDKEFVAGMAAFGAAELAEARAMVDSYHRPTKLDIAYRDRVRVKTARGWKRGVVREVFAGGFRVGGWNRVFLLSDYERTWKFG